MVYATKRLVPVKAKGLLYSHSIWCLEIATLGSRTFKIDGIYCTPIEGIIASVTVETRACFFSPVITVTAAIATPGFRIDNVDGLYLHTDCGNNFPVNPRSERPDRFTASVC